MVQFAYSPDINNRHDRCAYMHVVGLLWLYIFYLHTSIALFDLNNFHQSHGGWKGGGGVGGTLANMEHLVLKSETKQPVWSPIVCC